MDEHGVLSCSHFYPPCISGVSDGVQGLLALILHTDRCAQSVVEDVEGRCWISHDFRKVEPVFVERSDSCLAAFEQKAH